jgi:hypothetical protein
MKSPILLPAITALIGFSIAWIAKPGAPQSPAPAPAKTGEIADKRPARSGSSSRPTTADRARNPEPPKAGEYPLADLAEQGPKSRDEAKMLRLTEILDLSVEQQSEIIRLIEDVQARTNPDLPIIEELAIRGNEVEQALAKLLTPEQLAKFEQLRVRERENRIEARSQKLISQAIEDIDLTAEQREEVLNRLRQKSKADLQAIPASAALLFDQSMLPTKNKELSVDGLLQAARLGEHVVGEDPGQAYQRVLDQRKSELEALLRCFDGVLTPGQMGQYQAGIAEKNKQVEQMRQAMMSKGQPEKKSE